MFDVMVSGRRLGRTPDVVDKNTRAIGRGAA